MVRVMILCGLGINCEEETQAAYKLAGAETELVFINDLLNERYRIQDFNIVHFPGGFSFGDHLGAGRVLANRIRFKKTKAGKSFREEFLDFSRNGGFIFGICNGFQILVSLGLLPGGSEEASVSLIQNKSGNFQDEWVECEFNAANPLSKLWPSKDLYMPIRHGEGRLVVRDESIAKNIRDQNLIVMRYKGKDPNGSLDRCAALTNAGGSILGMMPHPEAYLSFYNNPQWCGKIPKDEKGEGLRFFENLVQHVGV